MSDRLTVNRPGASAEADASVAQDEQPFLSSAPGAERNWPLKDPMRIVRAERAAASTQIHRSITAWRKQVDGASAAPQPKIFLARKNGRGDDDEKKDGTPGNNRAQNRQFADAVREIEKRIGRVLSAEDRRKLHDAITGQNMGFHEIVEEGVALFGHK